MWLKTASFNPVFFLTGELFCADNLTGDWIGRLNSKPSFSAAADSKKLSSSSAENLRFAPHFRVNLESRRDVEFVSLWTSFAVIGPGLFFLLVSRLGGSECAFSAFPIIALVSVYPMCDFIDTSSFSSPCLGELAEISDPEELGISASLFDSSCNSCALPILSATDWFCWRVYVPECAPGEILVF